MSRNFGLNDWQIMSALQQYFDVIVYCLSFFLTLPGYGEGGLHLP